MGQGPRLGEELGGGRGQPGTSRRGWVTLQPPGLDSKMEQPCVNFLSRCLLDSEGGSFAASLVAQAALTGLGGPAAGWPWDFQGTLVSLNSTVNISWYVPYRVLGNDKVRVETRVF